MTQNNWTLTVNYDAPTNRSWITGGSDGGGDVVIASGDVAVITFAPGSGVARVSAFSVISAISSRVSITTTATTDSVIVTDVDNLLAADPENDLAYCVSFLDSNSTVHNTDPQLINKPQPRINAMLTPMPRATPQPAPRRISTRPATMRATRV
jgi:hypothetical protein